MCETILKIPFELLFIFWCVISFLSAISFTYSIYKLKNIYSEEQFFKLFPDSKDGFPIINYKMMNHKTLFKLFKVLLFNENNIKGIIGTEQKIFVYSLSLVLITFLLIIIEILYIANYC